MTRHTIEILARGLPVAGPYDQLMRDTEVLRAPWSELERIEQALCDCRFGANVASAYAAAGLPLPNLEWPLAVRRAHASWSNPACTDDNLVLAESLLENGGHLGLMFALSVCEDGTNEMLADCFQYDVEAITLCSKLFCNVRDRRHEPFYLAHLVEDKYWTGQTFQDRVQAQFGRDLLRLAIRDAGRKWCYQPQESCGRRRKQCPPNQ